MEVSFGDKHASLLLITQRCKNKKKGFVRIVPDGSTRNGQQG